MPDEMLAPGYQCAPHWKCLRGMVADRNRTLPFGGGKKAANTDAVRRMRTSSMHQSRWRILFFFKRPESGDWRFVSLSASAGPMVEYPLSAKDSSDTQTSATSNQNAKHQSAWIIESNLHVIERIPSEGRGRPTTFIPLRFDFKNKIDNDDRMLLAFDALVLSKLLARPIVFGKIIHGDNHTMLKVKTAGMASRAQMQVKKIAALLSNHLPPDLTSVRLNIE